MATITTNPSMTRTMPNGQVISEDVAQRQAVWKSVVTGQVAGLITAVAFMVMFLFMGVNIFYPIQVIGSFVLGEGALQGFSFGALVLGVLIHQLIIALVMGLAYGALARSTPITTYSKALMLGLGLGVVSMIGPYIIYPAVMSGAHGVDLWNREIPMVVSWIAYLIFGASFVLYPRIAQRFDQR